MKKFFIPFVLLFGFLIFTPHISRATDIDIDFEAVKENRECFVKHKLNLSREYKGPNFKLDSSPELRTQDFTSESLKSYFDEQIDDGWEYHIEYDSKKVFTVVSRMIDCETEEISFNEDLILGEADLISNPNFTAVNVIDVPPGSTLKYLPETREIKIISPNEESYKHSVEQFKVWDKEIESSLSSKIEERARAERKEKIKIYAIVIPIFAILSAVIVVIIALVVFLVKKILKKFKKRV